MTAIRSSSSVLGQASASCAAKLRALGYGGPLIDHRRRTGGALSTSAALQEICLRRAGAGTACSSGRSPGMRNRISSSGWAPARRRSSRRRIAWCWPTARRCTYAKLLLATGSRPRRLPASHRRRSRQCLHHPRSRPCRCHRARHLCPARRLLVIGGGYIGLEAAAVAASKGLAGHGHRNGGPHPAARGGSAHLRFLPRAASGTRRHDPGSNAALPN